MSNVDLWIIEKSTIDLFVNTKEICTKILNKYVDFKWQNITYNEYGKPRLPAGSKLFFNVSHTLNVLLVAVTHECELGIDVEACTRSIYNPLMLAKKFFHENEVKWLHESNELITDFAQLWVIKEAYVKMRGIGIGYGLSNFYVNTKRELIFDIKNNNYYNYSLFNITNNYICSIVPKFSQVNMLRKI